MEHLADGWAATDAPHDTLMRAGVVSLADRITHHAAALDRTVLYHRVRRFLTRYDFLLLPTVQVLPFDVMVPYPTSIAGTPMETYIDWMKSCYYISTLGLPALSVPAGFSATGLPVGLQIVGRHHDDFGVLQLGHVFEAATGFGRRRPALASTVG